MYCWVYTGEATTARVRRKYLQAVLRQNVGYFDKLGAGEVTTRIQTDTYLLQEGISDKIAITVMFASTFFTGFIVAYIRNWRAALVVSSIIPAIGCAGAFMNKFISAYRSQMLQLTAEGGTLAEEVFSSVRSSHAFGTQKKLTAMYDVTNLRTLQIGLKSAFANGLGLGVFFFIICALWQVHFLIWGRSLMVPPCLPCHRLELCARLLLGHDPHPPRRGHFGRDRQRLL